MAIQVSGEYGIVFEPEVKFSGKGTAWVKLRGKSTERVRDDRCHRKFALAPAQIGEGHATCNNLL
jgi:hypothetical protein